MIIRIPTDKQLHFFSAAALCAWLILAHPVIPLIHFQILPLHAFAITVVAAAMKEAYDKLHPQNHEASGWDFLASTAGALTSLVVYLVGVW